MAEFQTIQPVEMTPGKYITSSLLARLRNNLIGAPAGSGDLIQLVDVNGIAVSSINGDRWRDLSIGSAKLGTNGVTAANVAAGAITASKLNLQAAVFQTAVNVAPSPPSNFVHYIFTGYQYVIGYKTYAIMNGSGAWPVKYNFVIGMEHTAGMGQAGEVTPIMIKDNYGHSTNVGSVYFWYQYITASPPYDLGDGEIPIFIFARQAPGGDIQQMSAAPDPPWYNPAADIITRKDTTEPGSPNTRKFRAVRDLQRPSNWGNKTARDRYLADLRRPLADWPEEEITPAAKNAGIDQRPHPFAEIPPGHRAILLDPASDFAHQLAAIHADGGDVLSLIQQGYINLGDVIPERAGPANVQVVGARWKNTRRPSTGRPKAKPAKTPDK